MKTKKTKLYRIEIRWTKGGLRPARGTKRDNLPGWWEVRDLEGVRPFTNKLNAVRVGRQVALAHQPATLVIFTKEHRNQSERTYPRSRDPRRSKG